MMRWPSSCALGWPNALLLRAHKERGERHRGRSKWSTFQCPSFLPALWLATKLQVGTVGGPVLCACPSSHPRPKTGRPSSRRHAHSSKQQQRQSKRHRRARPNSHAPTVSGASELQGDVHNCPVAAGPKRGEGWVMRDVGGDRGGACRIKIGAAIAVGQVRPGYDYPGA